MAGSRRAGYNGQVDFPHALRERRTRRHLSQLDLALRAGTTQRHLSFIESGRSTPAGISSYAWAESLELPLRERNEILLAAGHAPARLPGELARTARRSPRLGGPTAPVNLTRAAAPREDRHDLRHRRRRHACRAEAGSFPPGGPGDRRNTGIGRRRAICRGRRCARSALAGGRVPSGSVTSRRTFRTAARSGRRARRPARGLMPQKGSHRRGNCPETAGSLPVQAPSRPGRLGPVLHAHRLANRFCRFQPAIVMREGGMP
jgi:transcriptional regulator with XRE-family HTH domain